MAIMSTVKATNFQNASSATANMVTDASGNVSFGGTAAMSSSFLRNRIINGDMRVDQRNAGSLVSVNANSAAFSVDRFRCQGQGSDGVFSVQRTPMAETGYAVRLAAGFDNYLAATVTTADATLGTNQRYFISQIIEGYNVADLMFGQSSAKTITLSFWVRSSLTGTFGGTIKNLIGTATRSYPFSYTISASNTWEQKTITIAGDTTGTWDLTNGEGLVVAWSLGASTDLSTTAGAWAAGNYWSATGATNVMATNGATFYVTGVQLEVGTVATPFERQIYNAQLAQCQRYYEHSYNSDTAVGTSTDTGTVSTKSPQADMQDTIQFAVEKRATPTITFYTNLGVSGSWRSLTAATNRLMGAINSGTRQFTWANSNSVTVGDVLRGHWTASIEL